MADRTIKPDDTNDLVLQNNDGSAKLELNEDQTVKVTTGSDSGEDFTVNTDKLVVEGDSGNVGIGTTSPSSYDSSHDNLVIVGTGHEGLTIISGTSSNATIAFGDGTGASGYQGMIAYLNADNAMTFRTTAVERMRIDSSGNLKFNSGFGSVETAYGCRAWVNFDGTSGSIGTGRASGNVSSITDNGTGDYTVNFTTAMPDANYAVTACGNQTTIASEGAGKVVSFLSPTTSSVRVRSGWFNNDRDFIYVCIAVFR